MKDLKDRVAILTGASRGIGVHIARALAKEGVHLALAARSAQELEAVRAEVEALGVKAIAVVTDVTAPAQLEALVDACTTELGPVDLLVNNAGIEDIAAYDGLSAERIDRSIDVNLRAPMHLVRHVLPGMVERDRGHIVNIASLAGLAPTAFGEAYNATKHGIVGFTRSIRASEQVLGSAVSASVICPGFVTEVGMYAQFQREGASSAPAMLGTSTPEQVADAVVRAIRQDLPEVIVNKGPMRLTFALSLLFPRFSEWLSMRIGAHDVFRSTAEARGTGRAAGR